MDGRYIKVLMIDAMPGAPEELKSGIKLRNALIEVIHVDRLFNATRRVAGGGIDLILLDISLPDSKGLDTFYKIREQSPGIPIIIWTDVDDDRLAVKAVEDGAQEYFVKGLVEVDSIVRAIHYSFERQRILSELMDTTKALRASRESLKTIIENNYDGIVIIDRDGTAHFANNSAKLLFDREDKEFIGKPFGFKVVPGKNTEIEIIRKDGKRINAEMCAVETDWEGKKVCVVSVRDITERKMVEELFTRSEEHYRIAVYLTSDISYELNPSGIFTFVSDTISQLGYSPKDLIGKHFRELVSEEDYVSVSRASILPKFKGKATGDASAPKLFDEKRTGNRMTKNLIVRLRFKNPPEGELPYCYAEINASGKWDRPTGEKEKQFMGTVGMIRNINPYVLLEEEIKYRETVFTAFVGAAAQREKKLHERIRELENKA